LQIVDLQSLEMMLVGVTNDSSSTCWDQAPCFHEHRGDRVTPVQTSR